MSEQELYMMSEEKAKVRIEAEPTPQPRSCARGASDSDQKLVLLGVASLCNV